MTVRASDKLEEFLESVENVKIKLDELRETIKLETSERIKEKIETEKLKEANNLIEELSIFLKVQFECNINDIKNYAKALQTGEKKEVKEISKYDIKTFKEENDEELHRISKNEIELIKEIGENGFFDQRQLKKYNEETLLKLNMKEYLEIEEVEYRGQKIYQFRLTMKGRKIFKEHFGKEITSPSREEIIEEFGDIEKGLLLYTAKEEFYKKGYEIEDINEERIEIMKEKVIIHLTPDFGIFRDVDYDEILNKTNQLKKIGFIAESEEIMKKSIQAVENWVEKNKNKSRMLKVHFTNLEKVKEKEPFEIKKY